MAKRRIKKNEDFVVINANEPKQSRQQQDQLTRKHGFKIPKDAELKAFVCSCGTRRELYIPKGKSPECPRCGLIMVPEQGLV